MAAGCRQRDHQWRRSPLPLALVLLLPMLPRAPRTPPPAAAAAAAAANEPLAAGAAFCGGVYVVDMGNNWPLPFGAGDPSKGMLLLLLLLLPLLLFAASTSRFGVAMTCSQSTSWMSDVALASTADSLLLLLLLLLLVLLLLLFLRLLLLLLLLLPL